MTLRYGVVQSRGRRTRPVSRLAMLGLSLAVAFALLAMLAGLGSRFDLWHFRTGFSLLRWSVYGGLAAAALSLVALLVILLGRGRRGAVLALLGLVVGLSVALVPWQRQRSARGVPPIHDITTDTENPPQFVAVLPRRADAPNPPEYGGDSIAAHQRAAYPDIRPLILQLPPQQAYERALEAARGMGWEIVAAEPAEGRIEATARTFWFGFRDDVVIRITPAQGGSRVDVRSKSRLGRGDMGTNARRVRGYLERVENS